MPANYNGNFPQGSPSGDNKNNYDNKNNKDNKDNKDKIWRPIIISAAVASAAIIAVTTVVLTTMIKKNRSASEDTLSAMEQFFQDNYGIAIGEISENDLNSDKRNGVVFADIDDYDDDGEDEMMVGQITDSYDGESNGQYYVLSVYDTIKGGIAQADSRAWCVSDTRVNGGSDAKKDSDSKSNYEWTVSKNASTGEVTVKSECIDGGTIVHSLYTYNYKGDKLTQKDGNQVYVDEDKDESVIASDVQDQKVNTLPTSGEETAQASEKVETSTADAGKVQIDASNEKGGDASAIGGITKKDGEDPVPQEPERQSQSEMASETDGSAQTETPTGDADDADDTDSSDQDSKSDVDDKSDKDSKSDADDKSDKAGKTDADKKSDRDSKSDTDDKSDKPGKSDTNAQTEAKDGGLSEEAKAQVKTLESYYKEEIAKADDVIKGWKDSDTFETDTNGMIDLWKDVDGILGAQVLDMDGDGMMELHVFAVNPDSTLLSVGKKDKSGTDAASGDTQENASQEEVQDGSAAEDSSSEDTAAAADTSSQADASESIAADTAGADTAEAADASKALYWLVYETDGEDVTLTDVRMILAFDGSEYIQLAVSEDDEQSYLYIEAVRDAMADIYRLYTYEDHKITPVAALAGMGTYKDMGTYTQISNYTLFEADKLTGDFEKTEVFTLEDGDMLVLSENYAELELDEDIDDSEAAAEQIQEVFANAVSLTTPQDAKQPWISIDTDSEDAEVSAIFSLSAYTEDGKTTEASYTNTFELR